MIRPPVVAGQFYPDSPDYLRSVIAEMVDRGAEKVEAIGLVCPHAGYAFSGPVAGATISRVNLKDTFILVGPNHTGYGKPLSIMADGSWKTPLGEVEIDSELAKHILSISSYLVDDELAHLSEHSLEVQLPFLQYLKPDIKIVPIVLAYTGMPVYKEIGLEIARAIKELNRQVVILASSDMTHYESQESAKEKDTQAIDAILSLDEDELMRRVEELNISMCGYAPTVVLISAARELGANKAELVRYQTSGDTTGDYTSVVGYAGVIITGMSPLVQLARSAVEAYVTEGTVPEVQEFTPEMEGKAGVFVSIHKQGELRGCIGTYQPTQPDVAREVITNAVGSATRDPRFPSIVPDELGDLDYSVDVLTPPEPVQSMDELDIKKYGVIVESDFRRGLLLPDLEGVSSVQEQVDICRLKAGIAPDEPVKLYRFQVKRYK
jgi:AmmeMemoRadiSam system protein B/AmmeMemoRadiSam system protein A